MVVKVKWKKTPTSNDPMIEVFRTACDPQMSISECLCWMGDNLVIRKKPFGEAEWQTMETVLVATGDHDAWLKEYVESIVTTDTTGLYGGQDSVAPGNDVDFFFVPLIYS